MVAVPAVNPQSDSLDTSDQPDLRRITEHDPALKRLKARTVRQLTQSVRQLVGDLRHGVPVEQAQSRFIQRHITLMRAAYEAAHEEGQRDYYGAVSRVPSRWAAQQSPDEQVMAKRLVFYAPSVAKMAHEATEAWHQTQYESTLRPALSDLRFPDAQGHSDDEVILLAGGIGEREDNLAKWQSSTGARITLQADLTWSGAQDGYVAAGFGDSANPYSSLWWDLEPTAAHCSDCPVFAANSPYDPPWTQGGNILNATPGDGNTECGAGCKCDLRYGGAVGATRTQDWKAWLPNGTPGLPDGPMQPVQPPAQKQPAKPQQPQQPTNQPAANIPPSPFEPIRRSPYGPVIPGGEFNAEQKKALDMYRLAELMWNDVRGQLPELPNFFTLANPNFTWERFAWDSLTKAQQKALSMALEAFFRWGAATPPEWLDYYDDYDLRESGDGADVVKLYNPYPRQKGGLFGFGGPGHVSGGGSHGAAQHAGNGHVGEHVGVHASARGGGGGGASHQHEEEHHAARIAKAEARHQKATEARETARAAHEHAAQKAEHAQAKMRAEEAKLRATQERVIAKTKGEVLAEQAVKAPKTFARYEAAKTEHEAVSAAIKSHEQEVQHAYNTIGRIQRETSEAHPEGFESHRAYRAALRQHADFEHYKAAEKTVKEQNARHMQQYRAKNRMESAEKQLIGKRLDPTSERIQNHPDMVKQRARLEKATKAYQEAASHGRETNEAYARAENEHGLARINLEAAHSPRGVAIQYGPNYGGRSEDSPEAAVTRVFGRHLSDGEVAQLAGAHEGDLVRITGTGHEIEVSMKSSANGSTNHLRVERTAQGEIVIHHEMVENEGAKTTSSGKEVIEGLRNWQRLGVTRLEATAARSDATHGIMRTRMNGYDTWAKLGFTGKIPHESSQIGYHNRDILAEAQAKFGKHVTRVEQLMKMGPEARRWWKENGDNWHATFSFKPNSYSMRTLAKYEAILNRHGS